MRKREGCPQPLQQHVSFSRARQVIAFIAAPENLGLSNVQVGKRLNLSEITIRAAKKLYRWGEAMKLEVRKIKRDGGLQPRAEMNDERIHEYSEDMKAGNIFPPLTVYYDGTNYWLADGYHRCAAALVAGIKKLDVEVKMGDRRDAILFAVGANRAHGLRRTNADKRRSVFVLLGDEEWSQWSDNDIARRSGVHQTFVGRLRCEMEPPLKTDLSGTPRKTSNGRTMNTAKIGRKPASTPPQAVAVADHRVSGEPRHSALVVNGRVVPMPATKVCPMCNGFGRVPCED